MEVRDLMVDFPRRWQGALSFGTSAADLGSGHHVIPGASASAWWEGGTLRLASLPLGEGMIVEEASVHLSSRGTGFGLRGRIGKGLLRGDGTIGGETPMDATIVGEKLALEALAPWIPGLTGAAGTIDQARMTFRGDPAHPLEADVSLRITGRKLRWEGRGWETLRLAATMTGRNMTLAECILRQGENEVTATGRSRLPSDWRALLRAPFAAEFRADLPDAGTLSTLLGPISPVSGGSLYLDGEVHGADNRAEGYCNFSGLDTRIRRLPLDWIRGCLLFEGGTTRVAHVEAQAGDDHLLLSGTVANSAPHAYSAKGELCVGDISRRLSELGLTAPSSLGAGAITATWSGEGDSAGHRGDFQAKVTEWVGPWTRKGLSGSTAGRYAPGSLWLDIAQVTSKDLKMTLRLSASTERLEVSDISVSRGEDKKPLASGNIALPLDVFDLWSGKSLAGPLVFDRALKAGFIVDGMKAEQLADLLGQEPFCSGKISGNISLAGTPARPIANGAIAVAGFSREGMSPGDLSVTATNVEGVTTLRFDQGTKGKETHLQAALPLHLTRRDARLELDPTTSLSGTATLQQVRLDGWEQIARGKHFPYAAGLTGEGTLTLGGTAGIPLVKGSLVLKASELPLPGSRRLTNLVLPISFSGTTGVLVGGTAGACGRPVSLSGEGDWSAAAKALIRLTGEGIPLEIAPGLRGTAQGDVTAAFAVGQPALISGRVALIPSTTDLHPSMTPSFIPPGYEWSPADDAPALSRGEEPRLDLTLVTTAHPTNATVPAIAADLRMTGFASAPVFSGTIELTDQSMILPSGTATLPSARVTCSPDGWSISGIAHAMTRRGMVSIGLAGSPFHPSATPEASWGDMAEALIALMEPRGADGTSLFLELPYWLRQAMLFPGPASTWARPRGTASPSALGFYGTPWGWIFQPFRTTTPSR